MSAIKYNETHFNWVRDNFEVYSSGTEMAKAFEKTFDIPMTNTRMRAMWQRLNLRKGTQHRYTQEEDLWLAENANTVPYSKLAELFNNKFNTSVSKQALQLRCVLRLGIYSDDPNKFNNSVAWNKLPLGSESVDKRTNTILVKTEKGWINKARYVYEQANGEIPNDHQVVFLDSDRQNFELDNLYCIPTKYMILMNRNNWFTKDRDLTLAAIIYCRLYYEIKEGENL
jgi:hypothetical protein